MFLNFKSDYAQHFLSNVLLIVIFVIFGHNCVTVPDRQCPLLAKDHTEKGKPRYLDVKVNTTSQPQDARFDRRDPERY